ncbi:hypothetical protein AURDEDRAFT_165032 [Auricularia subglabra TFB-10046 SS5]|nr:hypothetical protein AURDEDRAFT_165032 [Auricularia subglabra TFB-10046 SS5]
MADLAAAITQKPGYRPLFEDQFNELPRRAFPRELELQTIPPVYKHRLGGSDTPSYVLGWKITHDKFVVKYRPEGQALCLADISSDSRLRWIREYPQYRGYQPWVRFAGGGDCILSIISNRRYEELALALDDEFLEAAMKFWDLSEPPRWLRF